ncbi:MAG: histidine kinase dimerization/phospho-acceptor domain-containing protein, partial [Vicinamibacterales bacterium]
PLIVMVTANDDISSKLLGFSVGADDYLIKPIDPQELFTRVTILMGAREAHAREIKQRRRDAIHEIVTTICHELNSPLTAALGYLELVINEPELAPQHRADLGDCRVALDRMIEIIERLRTVDDRVVPYVGETRMIDLSEGEGGAGS